MGTDFFDGLVKTFSKTTKELGKTTRELGARAEQTIEAQKIRSKITGEERIIEKIKVDISKAQLSIADRTLLEVELKRKQGDRYSDKSSLFEYSDLLTVLGRGYVVDADYPSFSLLPDPTIKNMVDPKKITARLDENHKFFEEINRVYKHGNIQDELGNEFDKELVKQIAASKKKSLPWHENLTYDLVKASQDKLRKKLDNPLEIADSGISAYHNAPIEYTFGEDSLLFVRCDGCKLSNNLQ